MAFKTDNSEFEWVEGYSVKEGTPCFTVTREEAENEYPGSHRGTKGLYAHKENETIKYVCLVKKQVKQAKFKIIPVNSVLPEQPRYYVTDNDRSQWLARFESGETPARYLHKMDLSSDRKYTGVIVAMADNGSVTVLKCVQAHEVGDQKRCWLTNKVDGAQLARFTVNDLNYSPNRWTATWAIVADTAVASSSSPSVTFKVVPSSSLVDKQKRLYFNSDIAARSYLSQNKDLTEKAFHTEKLNHSFYPFAIVIEVEESLPVLRDNKYLIKYSKDVPSGMGRRCFANREEVVSWDKKEYSFTVDGSGPCPNHKYAIVKNPDYRQPVAIAEVAAGYWSITNINRNELDWIRSLVRDSNSRDDGAKGRLLKLFPAAGGPVTYTANRDTADGKKLF